jgi:DNA mismatch endonuclease (patch repair protein)
MTDRISRAARSRNMSRIRSEDTGPERLIRKTVFAMGYRFRLHRRDLPGTPDIVLVKRRKVIFVHGCFWHGHSRCLRAKPPTSNVEFWKQKIERNTARDRAVVASLQRSGWSVCVVWQCELRDLGAVKAKLVKFLKSR